MNKRTEQAVKVTAIVFWVGAVYILHQKEIIDNYRAGTSFGRR